MQNAGFVYNFSFNKFRPNQKRWPNHVIIIPAVFSLLNHVLSTQLFHSDVQTLFVTTSSRTCIPSSVITCSVPPSRFIMLSSLVYSPESPVDCDAMMICSTTSPFSLSSSMSSIICDPFAYKSASMSAVAPLAFSERAPMAASSDCSKAA